MSNTCFHCGEKTLVTMEVCNRCGMMAGPVVPEWVLKAHERMEELAREYALYQKEMIDLDEKAAAGGAISGLFDARQILRSEAEKAGIPWPEEGK